MKRTDRPALGALPASVMIGFMASGSLPRKGEEVELAMTTSGFGGRAVGRRDGLVFFVNGAVPGDRVRAVVVRRRRNFVEAELSQLLEASSDRTEPRCRHFGTCGGCRWQNLSYARQLEEKQLHVQDLLSRIGRVPVEVPALLPSARAYCYRNKMEFSFGTNRWLSREEIASGQPLSKGFALGLHVPRRYDKLVDVRECFLQSSLSADIVNRVREIALEQDWSPYDSRAHRGFLRNLVIRTSEASGEILVGVITSRVEKERMEYLASRLREEFPEVTSLVNAVNRTRSPVAGGEETIVYGSGEVTERIGDLAFRIPLSGFFQPNTLQAERLYELICKLAQPEKTEVLFDVYCGMGCIGLFLASRVARVGGFENDAGSVENARSNARKNGIKNARFQTCDASEALSRENLRRFGNPDIVVLDPPRTGLHKSVLHKLLRVRPRRIVYVSCNPATQARDIASLRSSYQVSAVQPLDMFPQTPHIECVARLDSIGKETVVDPVTQLPG